MSYTLEQEQELRARLEGDSIFYARKCLRIVDSKEREVALEAKPAQLRLEQEIREQEAAGEPVRVIVLKARKEGISTWVQGKMIKRISMRRNHKALVIAHDGDTAGELFEIGETMYSNLPHETVAGLQLKPGIISSRKGKELKLGEPSRQRRLTGDRGLNSSYYVDTANEYQSGRGFTYHSVHISELGFWQQAVTKLTAILNAVPDEPNTMIIIESTANGYNAFRSMWVDAVRRRSGYRALFIAWFEDPQYQRPFPSLEAREEFIASIGTGPYGDQEPELIEKYGVTPEQLHWRRWAIPNKCSSDLRTFWQEYPSTWEEAFLASGKQVFSSILVSKMIEECEVTDRQAASGLILPEKHDVVERRGRKIEVPVNPLWTPEESLTNGAPLGTNLWKVWSLPRPARPDLEEPAGQYVLAVDAASGEETEEGDEDYFSIQLIDHRTLEQVASWKARHVDADLVGVEAYLAALLYNRAWIGIETTGGYGLSIANQIWRIFRYGKIYFRKPPQNRQEKQEKRLGWNTGTDTKPLLVDHAKRLLREGRGGVRSLSLAGEFITYVKDDKGKMGAEENEHDDELMAWMIAQYIADEKPIAVERPPDPAAKRSTAPTMHVRPRAYAPHP